MKRKMSMMNPDKMRRNGLWMSVLAITPHLFCCGIPIIAALIALGGTAGLGAMLAVNPAYNFVDAYHQPLLALAFVAVILSGVFNFIAYRVDCREAACTHGACKPKKLKAFRIFIISCVLLILDIGWYMMEEKVFGLHHHHDHEHAHEEVATPDVMETDAEHKGHESHEGHDHHGH